MADPDLLLAFDASPHAALILRPVGVASLIERANRAAGDLLGIDCEEMRGENWYGWLTPHDVRQFHRVVHEFVTLDRTAPWEAELLLRSAPVSRIGIRLVSVPHPAESPLLVCYLDGRGLGHGPSPHWLEAESALEVLTRAVLSVRVEVGVAGQVTKVPSHAGRLLGRPTATIVGSTLCELFGHRAGSQHRRTCPVPGASGPLHRFGVDRSVDEDGISHRVMWLRSPAGENDRIEVSLVDLTEHRVAVGLLQLALSQGESRAVVGVRHDGRIHFANAAAGAMNGSTRADLVGTPVGKLLQAGGESAMASRHDLDGVPQDHVVVIDQPGQSDAEVLGYLDHELRTPLATVVGLAEMLLDGSMGELSDLHRAAMVRVARAADQLSDRLEELLRPPGLPRQGADASGAEPRPELLVRHARAHRFPLGRAPRATAVHGGPGPLE